VSPDTHTCPACWATFTPSPRTPNRIYCSDRCRRDAWNRRQRGETVQTPPSPPQADEPPLPQPTAHRDCPHCGGLITIVALLTTPEAARPTVPTHTDSVIPLRPAQHR
jgi:hypothetical protein